MPVTRLTTLMPNKVAKMMKEPLASNTALPLASLRSKRSTRGTGRERMHEPAVKLPFEGEPAAELDGFKPKRVFLSRVSGNWRCEVRSACND